jgi:hypothetical protein
MQTFEQINQEYNDAITAEYDNIQSNFIEEIRLKINEFIHTRDRCKAKCLRDYCEDSMFNKLIGKKKEQEVCTQLEQMMKSKGDYDVATFCKVSSSEKVQVACTAANRLHRKIQDLFNLHKKNGFDVSKEEAEFYALTTKPKSNTGGTRNKRRVSKRYPRYKMRNSKKRRLHPTERK